MARGSGDQRRQRKEEEKAEKVATFASVTGTEDASVSRRILKVLPFVVKSFPGELSVSLEVVESRFHLNRPVRLKQRAFGASKRLLLTERDALSLKNARNARAQTTIAEIQMGHRQVRGRVLQRRVRKRNRRRV